MKTHRFTHIAVLMGGVSSEREISILSGTAAAKALAEAGYTVTSVILDREELPDLPGIEAAFIALHGRFGEDGNIQKLLEERNIPYTGSDPASSALSFDKIATQTLLAHSNIPIPPHTILHSPFSSLHSPFSLPVVVKAPREGSSVGVVIAQTQAEFEQAITECHKYSPDTLLVEKFIPGREWTVSILDGEALPVIQIEPKLDGGWYSWQAKYFSNGTTVYSFPADDRLAEDGVALPSPDVELCQRCQDIAAKVFRLLGGRGMARVDFRISPEGDPFVLELNSIPGLTASSLLPKAAEKVGISFPELCSRIIESARV